MEKNNEYIPYKKFCDKCEFYIDSKDFIIHCVLCKGYSLNISNEKIFFDINYFTYNTHEEHITKTNNSYEDINENLVKEIRENLYEKKIHKSKILKFLNLIF